MVNKPAVRLGPEPATFLPANDYIDTQLALPIFAKLITSSSEPRRKS